MFCYRIGPDMTPWQPSGHLQWPADYLPLIDATFGKSGPTMKKWTFGVEKIWKCHSEFGNVVELSRLFPARVLGISSDLFIRIPFLITKILMVSTLPGLLRFGWMITSVCFTWIDQIYPKLKLEMWPIGKFENWLKIPFNLTNFSWFLFSG